MLFTPTKLYYKIREVSKIIDVEAHVLRYWETEFPSLSPPKTLSGQRIYRPRDIELLLQIRKLLYDEGFTIAGARKQLSSGKPVEAALPTSRARRKSPKPQTKSKESPKAGLSKVREELENILTLLNHE
jgi:DNA-binding transcriptional MerR regulator